MMNMLTADLYGDQVTRKFTDIFPDEETFRTECKDSAIVKNAQTAHGWDLIDAEINLTFYLLYSRYGNSHIASFDENQFKYKVWAIMFEHGPTWAKKLKLQQRLRNLTPEEIGLSKTIHNHSYNPSTAPSTAALEELPTINEQTSHTSRRTKGDSYAMLLSLIEDDVTEAYINRFKTLFLKFVNPALPLWYESERG